MTAKLPIGTEIFEYLSGTGPWIVQGWTSRSYLVRRPGMYNHQPHEKIPMSLDPKRFTLIRKDWEDAIFGRNHGRSISMAVGYLGGYPPNPENGALLRKIAEMVGWKPK